MNAAPQPPGALAPADNAAGHSVAQAREGLALQAFDHLVSHSPSFRNRPGQREMAAHIAHTLSGVALGDGSVAGDAALPARGIAVVQAGTGVGKSAAYAGTVIPLALAQQKRVVISTATVALQEQLIAKDLPALSAALPQPFAFALAKGRARYVCRLKLDQLAGGDAASADLFADGGLGDEAPATLAPAVPAPAVGHAAAAQRGLERSQLYQRWSLALDSGSWDGDRDRLDDPPAGDTWSAVAADRHSCTARHCPSYNSCSYYRARAGLAQAQVIVVNHDLLLSTLNLHALPAPQDAYLVLDEAHHLASVAQGQFTEAMDLTRSQWLDRLPRAVEEVASAMHQATGVDVAVLARELKAAQAEWARQAMARLGESPQWQAATARGAARGAAATRRGTMASGANNTPAPFVERLERGDVPADWLPCVAEVQRCASALLKVLESLGSHLKQQARDNPGEGARCAQLYSRLGTLAPRLQHAQATSELWLQKPMPGGSDPTDASSAAASAPLAKWLEADSSQGTVTLTAHACPLQPGHLLHNHLWSQVRAAVVTSASLTSCGTFDHFLHEAGLVWDAAVSTREVQSPFDHARQGRLVVVQTQADPKDVEAYTHEMLDALFDDFASVQRGALVLFTSRAQLRQAQDRLERGAHAALRDSVLVQGDASRAQLLRRHAERVAAGSPSILFGLQSFGEGLDLPGELCEWVFITKLPFASPSDPVGQARADWLRAQGRDPFSEIVVPATGARLLQWTGRALRTETDQAVVVCYDARLLRQAYGRRMLQGLPPYKLQRRIGGVLTDL